MQPSKTNNATYPAWLTYTSILTQSACFPMVIILSAFGNASWAVTIAAALLSSHAFAIVCPGSHKCHPIFALAKHVVTAWINRWSHGNPKASITVLTSQASYEGKVLNR